TGVVEAGVRRVVGALGDPRVEIRVKLGAGDDRLTPETAGPPAAQQDAEPVDLEAVPPGQRPADDLFGLPAHQEEGGIAVEEVMLAGALPDEVPRVIPVHAQDAAPLAGRRLELAGMLADDVALAERQVVGVIARPGRHEADSIGAAVRRVA